jgi:cob(I)alamin adenosyltransferase
MHIYTRCGDDGKTTLLNGRRVWKDEAAVQVCGDVDELCSWLGVVAAHVPLERSDLAAYVRQAQAEVFTIGAVAQLRGRIEVAPDLKPVGPKECRRLEQWIDALEADVPPLNGFITPGGTPAAAFTHVARTVCRRVERNFVALFRQSDAEGGAALTDALVYLNRLSDFLFMLARICNRAANANDTIIGKIGCGTIAG